jgi:hypothetical protein
MNKRRSILILDGARYYEEGDYIYSRDGEAEFFVTNGWWYPIHGGAAAYYVRGAWVYSQEGKPAFYYN